VKFGTAGGVKGRLFCVSLNGRIVWLNDQRWFISVNGGGGAKVKGGKGGKNKAGEKHKKEGNSCRNRDRF